MTDDINAWRQAQPRKKVTDMHDAARVRRTPRRTVFKPLALSFVTNACFWNVAGTGDYGDDCEIGKRLALEYLALEAADENGPGHLPKIVADMPRELTGIEIAFLTCPGCG